MYRIDQGGSLQWRKAAVFPKRPYQDMGNNRPEPQKIANMVVVLNFQAAGPKGIIKIWFCSQTASFRQENTLASGIVSIKRVLKFETDMLSHKNGVKKYSYCLQAVPANVKR